MILGSYIVILGDFKVTNFAKSLFLKYLHQMLYPVELRSHGLENTTQTPRKQGLSQNKSLISHDLRGERNNVL